MKPFPVRLVVPPQDDAGHLAGWYLLNVHLQRSLGISCVVEPGPGDAHFRDLLNASSLIVLASAHQALTGIEEAGWLPVARPVGIYDELMVLARREGAAPHSMPVRVGCASLDSWLPRVGGETLTEHGLPRNECEITALGSEHATIQALLEGNTDLALLDRRAWSGLVPAVREQLYCVTESRQQRCFSMLCLSRDLAALQGPLTELLLDLPAHSTGEHLLTDLGYPGFEPVPGHALAKLRNWLFETADAA